MLFIPEEDAVKVFSIRIIHVINIILDKVIIYYPQIKYLYRVMIT